MASQAPQQPSEWSEAECPSPARAWGRGTQQRPLQALDFRILTPGTPGIPASWTSLTLFPQPHTPGHMEPGTEAWTLLCPLPAWRLPKEPS